MKFESACHCRFLSPGTCLYYVIAPRLQSPILEDVYHTLPLNLDNYHNPTVQLNLTQKFHTFAHAKTRHLTMTVLYCQISIVSNVNWTHVKAGTSLFSIQIPGSFLPSQIRRAELSGCPFYRLTLPVTRHTTLLTLDRASS